MKILHTSEFYAPSVGGAQEVVRQLSERLAARGHEVTVATTALPERSFDTLKGVRIAGFQAKGNLVRGMSGEIARYQDFVLQGGFDVVMNYAAQQWTTDALLELLPGLKAAKVLVPCGFSGLADPAYAGYFQRMPAWLGAYDACVYLSDEHRDVRFAREHDIHNGRLIPNAAGEDEFAAPVGRGLRQRLGLAADEKLVLSVGSHTALKGHSEAIAMFKRARTGPATLLIIGNSFGGGCSRSCALRGWWSKVSPAWRRERKRVLVTPMERIDTVAAYQEADVFLFPSNIEASPLVLFEACAAGLPYLSSPAGNAAEITAWTGGGRLLSAGVDGQGYQRCDVAAGAQALEVLLADSAGRKRLGAAGRKVWQDRFTWEKVTAQYEGLYQGLIKGAHAA